MTDASQSNGSAWPMPQPLPFHKESAAPYPMDALPPAIQRAATEVARFAMVPEVSPAVIGLSVAAVAIGKKARLEERAGLCHYPSLFYALIAESGERKSPPFKLMTHLLEEWSENQIQTSRIKREEALAANRVTDKLTTTLEREAAKKELSTERRMSLVMQIAELNAKRHRVPPLPRFFTTDTTEERLFQKLHDHNGQFAVFSGEGRPVFDALMGKYSGQNRTGDAIYLAGISGDTITRDRVGGEDGPEERVIYNPCLNVCVMVQPDKYLETARHPALRASGALARIQPVMLPSLVGQRMEKIHDPGLVTTEMEPYRKTITTLLQTQMPLKPDETPLPHQVALSPEATEARRNWHNTVEGMMGSGQPLDDVRDIASKAVSFTCKTALVLHITQNPACLRDMDSQLSIETWQQAQRLGTFHLLEAVRVQRIVEGDESLKKMLRIGQWLVVKDIETFTIPFLCRFAPRPKMNSKIAREMVDMMGDLQWIAPIPAPLGGRAVQFAVNPKLKHYLKNDLEIDRIDTIDTKSRRAA